MLMGWKMGLEPIVISYQINYYICYLRVSYLYSFKKRILSDTPALTNQILL
jgi:hypothetical protein